VTSADRDEALLRYIQESIVRIGQYTGGGRAVFLSEPMVQDAVLHRLETLADAASHLSDGLKARHPEIPWRDIYGFRNVAAHGYLTLDMSRVWNTVEGNLPALKNVVEQELRKSD
jgi:uncharacterized protein with HEPN domain